MPETPDSLEEFPRQVARTRGFSLGVPRSFTVSPDGERVVYLRTKTGDDPGSCLWVFDVDSGDRVEIRWDLEAFPYLARVTWDHEPLTLLVQTREQRTVRLLEADPASGEASILSEHTDPRWISLVDDAPVRLSDGRVVDVVADPETDTYVLTVAGELVTPPGLQVREVVSAGDGVLFRASDGDPTEIHLWWLTPGEGAVRLSEEPGVHSGAKGGEVLVRISASPNAVRSVATVVRSGEPVGAVENVSEVPVVDPRPRFLTLGGRELRAALLLPGGRRA